MSEIKAIRNDGKEYSKAEGSLKTIFKMIYTLQESKSCQIIVNKEEFDEFIVKTNMINSILRNAKFFDIMTKQTLEGRIRRAVAIGYSYGLEVYFVEYYNQQVNHYLITKVLVDGKVVYIIPDSTIKAGLMKLTI